MTPQSSSIPAEWQATRNILAVRLDNLGDVLLTTPAIHALKAALPAAEIALLTSPVGAQAGRLNRDIADVIAYESPFIDPWRRLPHDSAREQSLIGQLRRRHFDAAVIFSSFRQSVLPAAYLCYLADIPLRLGASVDGSGSLLTTRYRHADRIVHEVERSLALVGAIGVAPAELDLVLDIPDAARAGVRRWGLGVSNHNSLNSHTLSPNPLVVMHPGCSMPARTYPWELYGELADRLIAELGAKVAITGGADERELVEHVRDAVHPGRRGAAHALAGALEFPELGALIEAADLVITNNTGPMHVAAAVKTPVLALFALTNPPEQWGPWRVPHRLLYHDVSCRICYSRVCPYGHECLRLVTPAMVVAAACELLDETATARRSSAERSMAYGA
jgi:lipopolysaccharide heptosyltransferase II